MHELSVATAVAEIAERHAGGRRVLLVGVRVGHLRQVVPDSLRFAFEAVTSEGPCAGARLEVTAVPLRLRCACGHEWEPGEPRFVCPACDTAGGEILAGEELDVEWIEIDEEAACTAHA